MKTETIAETTTERRLFDIPAAVEYLRGIGASGATVNFVRSLIASGSVAHVKIGKRFFVSRAELDRWIDRAQRKK